MTIAESVKKLEIVMERMTGLPYDWFYDMQGSDGFVYRHTHATKELRDRAMFYECKTVVRFNNFFEVFDRNSTVFDLVAFDVAYEKIIDEQMPF